MQPELNQTTEDAAATPLLVAERLGRRIEERWIWRDLSFEVRPNEVLAIAGPSGSGKTLLLRGLALLDALAEGALTLDGRRADAWEAPAWRTHVLYMHQRPALLEGTVEDNLRRVFTLHARRDRRYDRDEAAALMERLGRAPEMLTQRVDRLSGGEAQTVALVRALLAAPDILLLDEPTASLDEEATRRAEAVILAWRKESPDRACVWVSHSPSQRERVSDRTISLEATR